jgi:hypothetical protein
MSQTLATPEPFFASQARLWTSHVTILQTSCQPAPNTPDRPFGLSSHRNFVALAEQWRVSWLDSGMCREERERVEAAGGAVENDRIQGNLNLSRALGDHQYKANKALGPEKQMITAYPDVSVSLA